MRINFVFGLIAVLIACIFGGVLIVGWIYLIHKHGLAQALDFSFSSQAAIVQQTMYAVLAMVFGVGGASLLTARK